MSVNDVEATGRVQAVDRAIALLNALGSLRDSETAQVLADRCGLNRSTAWRLLLTLEHHGLVDRDEGSNRYRIGLGIMRLANSAGNEPLVRRAHPLIVKLAEKTGETTSLAVPRGLEVVFADQAQSGGVISMQWLGRTVPLHATSTGKAFLAALPLEDLELALAEPLTGWTAETITDKNELLQELGDVRTKGYAECRGEFEPMLWGISVPVLDQSTRPVGIVSLWGTEARVKPRMEELSTEVSTTALDLTDMLSGDGHVQRRES